MSTTVLVPTLTFKSWKNDGTPNANGTVATYQAGTVTPLATYTDSTGTTQNSNPITLNGRGEANIWIPPNVAYKFIEYDSSGAIIKTTDQVTQQQMLSLYGGVDTGAVNAYIVSYEAPYSSYQDGIGIYWIPANTNTGASTLNVSFNGGSSFAGIRSITNADGTALSAGQILIGQVMFVLYKGGNFILTSILGSLGTGGVLTVGGLNVTGATVPANGWYLSTANTLAWSTNTINRGTVNSAGTMELAAASGAVTLQVDGTAGQQSATIYEQLNSINAQKNVATYETGTFTGTLTGCTTAPTATFNWSRNGNWVAIDCVAGLSATSNTTAMTITGLPAALTPASFRTSRCYVLDAGIQKSALCSISSTTLTFLVEQVVSTYVTPTSANFTSSGTKGITAASGVAGFSIGYQLT